MISSDSDSEDDSSEDEDDELMLFDSTEDLDSDSEDETSKPQLDDELDLAAFFTIFYLTGKMAVFFAKLSTAFASYFLLLYFFGCDFLRRALGFASSFSSALMSRFLFS